MDFQVTDLSGAAATPGLQEYAKWESSIKKLQGNVYEITIKGVPEAGWHLYSQFTEEGGALPTTFTYNAGKHYTLEGKTKELGKIKEELEPLFGAVVKQFEGNAIFTQKVKVTDPEQAITGFLTFMACNASTCSMPTDVDFHFVPAKLSALIGVEANKAIKGGTEAPIGTTPLETYFGLNKPQLDAPLGQCGVADEVITAKTGFFKIFLLGFFGGLLALLTPCVFPMIPLTVSFFTKRSPTRKKGLSNALIYASSIILIYVLLGFLVTVTLGSDQLNTLASSAFFIVKA